MVVGTSFIEPGNSSTQQAFRWTADTNLMTSLGVLCAGSSSIGAGVSADGNVVVGDSCGKAFIWTSGEGMRSIQQSLIDSGVTGLDGWNLKRALAVSNDGAVILGKGDGPAPYGSNAGWIARLPRSPSSLLSALITYVHGLNLAMGIENSLDVKLSAAESSLAAARNNSVATACNQLGAFINEVSAQSGKKLTTAQASKLIADANAVKNALHCG